MFCLVLEFGEEKRIFAKVEGDNVDFFFKKNRDLENTLYCTTIDLEFEWYIGKK